LRRYGQIEVKTQASPRFENKSISPLYDTCHYVDWFRSKAAVKVLYV
jgi:hypothetical protein